MPYQMITVLIGLLIVVLFLGGGYMAYAFLYCTVKDEREQPARPAYINDDMSRAIVELINDTYSPLYAVKLTDHLMSDIDIDSLDIVDLLFDVSQIAGVELNAHDLYRQYGRNPTVAQLIAFARSAMDKSSANSANDDHSLTL